MSNITSVLLFIVGCVFTQNIVFIRLLGACALDESRSIETALGYGVAATVVMVLASACTWLVDRYVLMSMNLEYLRLVAFVAIIWIAAFLVEQCVAKARPALAEALDGSFIYFAANCAVLGIAVLNVESAASLGASVVNGLLGGLGFLLAIALMAGVQERLETSRVPEAMRGLPITLVSASLIALAFMGFMGIA